MGTKYTNGSLSFTSIDLFTSFMNDRYGMFSWFLDNVANEFYYIGDNCNFKETGWYITETEDEKKNPVTFITISDQDKLNDPEFYERVTPLVKLEDGVTVNNLKDTLERLSLDGFGNNPCYISGSPVAYIHHVHEIVNDKVIDNIVLDPEFYI